MSPNRNMWNNNGTWWLRWKPIQGKYKFPRLAASLGTSDVNEARQRRDSFIGSFKNFGKGAA